MRAFLRRRTQEVKTLHRASHQVPLLIRLIAAGKLLKGLFFVAAGVLTARVAHIPDLKAALMGVLERVHFDPAGERVQRLIAACTAISHERLKLVAAGMFLYAVLYLVEGLGLWFDRYWAEWLVVVGTTVLIPVEVEHLWHKPSWGIAVVLLVNLAVALFLGFRIAARRRAARDAKLAG